MYAALVILIIGIVLLVLAYTLPPTPPPIRTLCLAFGWILTIVGGILLILAILALAVLPAR